MFDHRARSDKTPLYTMFMNPDKVTLFILLSNNPSGPWYRFLKKINLSTYDMRGRGICYRKPSFF
jgi:hypothetical protein